MMHRQTDNDGACARSEADLVLFHYGELTGAAREQIEEHLRDCAGCSRYLVDLAQVLPQTVLTDEPPPEFWQDYSRELRHKLADARARQNSWQRWFFLAKLRIPALATAAILVLVLSFTVDNSFWMSGERMPQDEALLEVLPITENLEFYNNLELLENMELLEFMGESRNGA
jgi:hypothetical protein